MLTLHTTRKLSRKLKIALIVSLTVAAWGLSATPGRAQHSEPVSLYVTVEQGDKLIRGLQHQNFRLVENGEPREFRLEQSEKPVSIALLVEYGRNSGLYFNDIRAALQGFMKAAPQDDWLAAATFSNSLDVRADFTRNRGAVEDAFAGLGRPCQGRSTPMKLPTRCWRGWIS